MIDENVKLAEMSKIFKIQNLKNKQDLLQYGYNENDINTVEQFITNRIDPISWIRNNVVTKHPAYGSIKFDLYDFQEKIIKIFLKKHFVIALKSRQVGMSTLSQALCLWAAMNYTNYNVIVLSVNQRTANSFLSKIKFMYNNLPNNMFKLKTVTDNKLSIEFENGSKIAAIPSTRQAALGESINLLIIDEAAFIRNIGDVYQGAYPTLSKAFSSAAGKPYGVIIISTPNGVGGDGKFYYDTYTQAVRGENAFVPVKIHWSLVPEYDDKWYEDQCKNLRWDYQQIAAELELSFVSSGATFIPGPVLDSIQTVTPHAADFENKLWVWDLPDKDDTYVAGVDVAYGNRADYSVMQILNARTLEQVAEFESNVIKVDDFANTIIHLGRQYNNCLINIERNTCGKILIEKILDKTNGVGINLYRDTSPGDVKDAEFNYKMNIGTLVTGQSRSMILGNMYDIIINNYVEGLNNIVSTEDANFNAKDRFQSMISGKNSNITRKVGIIKSQRLLSQFLKFVKNGENKFEADHDDLIFAYAHALYCYVKCKEILLKNYVNIVNSSFNIGNTKTVNYDDKLNFMKRFSDSNIWKDMDLDTMIEYEAEEINRRSNNDSNNASSTTANVIKSFYGF